MDDRFAADLHVAARDLVRTNEAAGFDEAVAQILTANRLYVAKSDGESVQAGQMWRKRALTATNCCRPYRAVAGVAARLIDGPGTDAGPTSPEVIRWCPPLPFPS
jgi:hypothetical protein